MLCLHLDIHALLQTCAYLLRDLGVKLLDLHLTARRVYLDGGKLERSLQYALSYGDMLDSRNRNDRVGAVEYAFFDLNSVGRYHVLPLDVLDGRINQYLQKLQYHHKCNDAPADDSRHAVAAVGVDAPANQHGNDRSRQDAEDKSHDARKAPFGLSLFVNSLKIHNFYPFLKNNFLTFWKKAVENPK